MLPLLPDDLLLDAYRSALRLRLEREFVHLLRSEIRRRKLTIPEERVF
ncbi:sporulation histidine kinase inhibitor Sda [Cohnella cholangitidis]|uniref:Sporulation histidine kinase inhibitor Sda n=1 Tax=Cohnella cholangitidis TaxID=2598458 RepID=A0A7G5BVA4_9BACL|nr:sporulation histidine kinase inhibitor Sda [Cohnella cholangitidis]QMV40888.1 sporulation histidine kinase inhibitor Sda [Cohnella cholangitidis]